MNRLTIFVQWTVSMFSLKCQTQLRYSRFKSLAAVLIIWCVHSLHSPVHIAYERVLDYKQWWMLYTVRHYAIREGCLNTSQRKAGFGSLNRCVLSSSQSTPYKDIPVLFTYHLGCLVFVVFVLNLSWVALCQSNYI